MHIEIWVAIAALVVGFVVGLTGMGGGALMTPILVLFFHIQPLAAVSSDLVASVVMKPVGSAVHLRRHSFLTRRTTYPPGTLAVSTEPCDVSYSRDIGVPSPPRDGGRRSPRIQ